MSFTGEQDRARALEVAKIAQEAFAYLSLSLIEDECSELITALETARGLGLGTREDPTRVKVSPFTLRVYHRDSQYNVDPAAPENPYTRIFSAPSTLVFVSASGNLQFSLRPRSGRAVMIERRLVKSQGYMYYVTNTASLM